MNKAKSKHAEKVAPIKEEDEDPEDMFMAASKRFAASEIMVSKHRATDEFDEFSAGTSNDGSIASNQRNTMKVDRGSRYQGAVNKHNIDFFKDMQEANASDKGSVTADSLKPVE